MERAIQGAERAIAEAARSGDTATRGKAHYVLAQEAPLSGRAAEGIGHALEALGCLERAGDQWWVGQAHWVVGLNHAQLGELAAALEAETRARTIGEATGNPQLQASALCATGIVHTALGQTETGIDACERSLAIAPDPLTRAVALGWLGFALSSTGMPRAPFRPSRPRSSSTARSPSRNSRAGSPPSWPRPIDWTAGWSGPTRRRGWPSRSPGPRVRCTASAWPFAPWGGSSSRRGRRRRRWRRSRRRSRRSRACRVAMMPRASGSISGRRPARPATGRGRRAPGASPPALRRSPRPSVGRTGGGARPKPRRTRLIPRDTRAAGARA